MDHDGAIQASKKLGAQLAGWHHESRETALVLAERLGPPDELTRFGAAWVARGPWKRTAVLAQPVVHRWPRPHHDVLEQSLDHHAPMDVALLLAFHGGLSYHRTRGELSVCCASEPANFCAMNLAHDLDEGRTTLHGARRTFARKFARAGTDVDDPYLTRLLFGRQVGTADPDEPEEARSAPFSIGGEQPPPPAGRRGRR